MSSKFAEKHNSSKRFNFDIPEHYEYYDLKQVHDHFGMEKEHRIHAILTNSKGKFGEQPVLATDFGLVNAPHHMMKVVRDIYADAESISLINNGCVGFKLYTYENSYGVQLGVEWVDLEPTEN